MCRRISLLLMLIVTCMVSSAYGDMIQTGTISNNYLKDSGTWNLHVGEPAGERYFLQHVDFQQPYTEQPPTVLVMLSGIDSLKDTNERVLVTSEDITNYGFTVRYTTWADTRIYGIFVTWIAIPKSMALYNPTYSAPLAKSNIFNSTST